MGNNENDQFKHRCCLLNNLHRGSFCIENTAYCTDSLLVTIHNCTAAMTDTSTSQIIYTLGYAIWSDIDSHCDSLES